MNQAIEMARRPGQNLDGTRVAPLTREQFFADVDPADVEAMREREDRWDRYEELLQSVSGIRESCAFLPHFE